MNSSPIPFETALQIVLDAGRMLQLPSEQIALSAALGRVLAMPVSAQVDLPGFDNSAMDGFALRHADLAGGGALRLIGEQFAGSRQPLGVQVGECVRITTGAPLPEETDTVLIKENARVEGDRVEALQAPALGANVRLAGEDFRAGDVLADAGECLDPLRIATLAAGGCAAVLARRQPRVAVLATGDELRAPGRALAAGEIYDSNRYYLMAALRAAGLDPVGFPTLPDQPGALRAALQQAAESFDVILTCGGVSAGERDLLPGLIRELGEVLFWKVRIKPGMPVLLGRIRQALVLALPGNPVSVLATFTQLGLPLLNALQGRAAPPPRWPARLTAPLHKGHARAEFRRGIARLGADGVLGVEPHAAEGSHRLAAAAVCNVLIVLPEGPVELAVGAAVAVSPYGAILTA